MALEVHGPRCGGLGRRPVQGGPPGHHAMTKLGVTHRHQLPAPLPEH
jgi:hypothetical protein